MSDQLFFFFFFSLLLLSNEEVKPLYNQVEEPELENLPIAPANENPFPTGSNAC